MDDVNSKKYGIKLSIISQMDYDDFKMVADAIQEKGFKITMVDNNNIVCEKEVTSCQ